MVTIKMLVRRYLDSNIYKSTNYAQLHHWVNVRREGRIVKIQESKLLVGDVLLFSTCTSLFYSEDVINVDGIIIKTNGNLVVD